MPLKSKSTPRAAPRHTLHSSGRSPTSELLGFDPFFRVTEGVQLGQEDKREEFGEDVLGTIGSPELKKTPKINTGAVLDNEYCNLSLERTGVPESDKVQHNHRLAVDLAYDDAADSLRKRVMRVLHNLVTSFKMTRLFLSLAWTDTKNRTCSYCLGFFSVLVVVLLCVVMISLLTNMPIVFLRLSEASRGEYDVRIASGSIMAGAVSINYTMIRELFPPSDALYGLHAPRIMDNYAAYSLRNCPGKTVSSLWTSSDGTVCSSQSECMRNCSSVGWTVVDLVALDGEAETRMGFGAAYSAPTPGPGEAVLSERAALLLGKVSVGDVVLLTGDARPLLPQAFINYGDAPSEVIMHFTVIAIVDADSRKFSFLSSFVVVNFNTVFTDVAAGLSPSVPSGSVATVAATDSNECASYVFFNMPPYKRLSVYRSTSFNKIRRELTAWTSGMLSQLGYLQVRLYAPQVSGLYSSRMMSVFLGLILSVILLALAFLSIVLIYTLLTVGLETRTYELGIQRMVGFTKENLVVLVLCNAYSFTLPAWLLGLAAGQAVYIGIRQVFLSMVQVQLPIGITGASVGWATLAGLGIPIVASYFPILALLTQRLPDALNTSRSRGTGVVFKIRRGGSSQMNGTMFGLGVLLFVFGFLIYYLFPTGLIAMNLTLIFYIFFAVLIGLLGGFVLLTLNIERVCQICVSYLLLFWESKAVFTFMQKSLSAHRQRNRKTTLMYALSLAFIIFLTVAVQIELTAFVYTKRRAMGCEVLVMPGSLSLRDYWKVEEYLKTHVAQGSVSAYTYEVTHPVLANMSDETLYSLGRYRSSTSDLVPIPPNYFDVLDSAFLLINHVDELVGRYGLAQCLYSSEGMRRGLMSSGAASYLGVGNAEGVLLLDTFMEDNATSKTTKELLVPARPVATLDLTPVQTMSKYSQDSGSYLIGLSNLLHQLNNSYGSMMESTVTAVRLRVPHVSQYGRIGDAMVSLFSSLGYTATITTIDDETEDMATANNILNMFFIFAELMILLICFFSLMSSMTTNVLNSSKEIGVLLCMGMTHFQIYRVYVWEAFILVVASGVTGLLVGIIVAYTMLLQQILLTQITFPFPFPYLQLVIVVAVGLVSALAASISPVAYLMGMPSVTHILRRSVL